MDGPNNLPVSTSHASFQPLQINRNHPSSDGTLSNPSPTRSCNHCVSRFMLFLALSLLIVTCVVAIAWIVINPQDPTFRLTSLSASNVTLFDSRFAAEYDLEFNVNNTGKKANLVIDHVRIVVSYGKAIVSESILEEIFLYIPKMSHQKLKVELGRDSARSIKNSVFVKDLSDDWSKKMVNFSFEMFFRAKYQLGVWPSKNKSFYTQCIDLTIEFFSTKGKGKLMGAGKNCFLHLS